MFVNEIGEYEGEPVEPLDADNYQLDVNADGNWVIEIRQHRAVSGDGPPQSVTDDKPPVFGPLEFNGSYTASGSHGSDENFQVRVCYPKGNSANSSLTRLASMIARQRSVITASMTSLFTPTATGRSISSRS